MSEAEKQEGQKTVVAFIAGLLIGGLLVWVFSSTPESAPTETADDDTTSAETDMSDDDDTSDTTASDSDDDASSDTTSTPNTSGSRPSTGDGSLVVADQSAGGVVVIDSVTFPGNEGWIGVRDYDGGVGGSVLGAARYHLDVGLVPEEVLLLRNTTAGSDYQVVFYTENGDRIFDPTDDALVEGSGTVFTAQ